MVMIIVTFNLMKWRLNDFSEKEKASKSWNKSKQVLKYQETWLYYHFNNKMSIVCSMKSAFNFYHFLISSFYLWPTPVRCMMQSPIPCWKWVAFVPVFSGEYKRVIPRMNCIGDAYSNNHCKRCCCCNFEWPAKVIRVVDCAIPTTTFLCSVQKTRSLRLHNLKNGKIYIFL
jgi:hypothetical protein